jgi:large subunit ribosomal protein L9
MKVLLIKDVYKLGHAGDVKRVADGFGRNFLLPQGLAVLATPGAINQSGKIREEANKQRAIINNEMAAIAEIIKDVTLAFAAKAGETGKMYGSITTQDVSTALQAKTGVEVKRNQIDMQPLRTLGEHKALIRLTMDLIPDIKVIIYREGENNPTEPPPVAKPQAPVAAASSPVVVVAEEQVSVAEELVVEMEEQAPVAEEPVAEVEEQVFGVSAQTNAPVAEEPVAEVEEQAPVAEASAPVVEEQVFGVSAQTNASAPVEAVPVEEAPEETAPDDAPEA